jgi:hypothetical protein
MKPRTVARFFVLYGVSFLLGGLTVNLAHSLPLWVRVVLAAIVASIWGAVFTLVFPERRTDR